MAILQNKKLVHSKTSLTKGKANLLNQIIDSRFKIGGIKSSFLMHKLLIPLFATIALPIAVNAQIDKETAEFCLKAADFAGCVEAMTGEGFKVKKV